MKWITFCVFYVLTSAQEDENLEIVSKTRTSYLQKYGGYVDVVVMHVEIPAEVSFASLKFTADETEMSRFSCNPRKVLMYMKHKSLPVINPDDSKFPDSFKNISRSQYSYLEIMTDKSVKYLNLTSPDPGCYFVTAFLPYDDPKHEPIQPPELTPECYAFVEATLYIRRRPSAGQIVEGASYAIEGFSGHGLLYTFFVPEFVTHATIIAGNISFSDNTHRLVIRVQSRSLPTAVNVITSEAVEANVADAITVTFNTLEDNWHFVEFLFEGVATVSEVRSKLTFTLKYFAEDSDRIANTTAWRVFNSNQITSVMQYKQYDLVRESTTESFSYSYELRQKFTISTSVAVNLTNREFTVLQFKLREHADIGGTLHFILAFKPRLDKNKVLLKEPPGNKIIACIRPEAPELPTWPNFCSYGENQIVAPLFINATTDNSSMMIPYPESGVWYATFKLFCGECVPCNCPDNCQKKFDACVKDCQMNCQEKETCNNCSLDCKSEVVNSVGCAECDCDGPCASSGQECESSVVFDISSTACANNCGNHGRCLFMVCDGVVYATCVCSDNYRGWDCSDDSQATPYYMIVLELLLLVLSNLMFLPTVYIAYRRKYYVEAIVYFAICFFSTFYHSCDAGEKIISFCITRLAALQFADFYCAVLAIWVTLIAIADLPSYWPTICHITGAIIMSFTTTINKTGIWGLVYPVLAGLIIIGGNWFLKWRRMRRMFLHRRYVYVCMPAGLVVVCVGLVIFAFLETEYNYKYTHSAWHILMAVGVIILLPQADTFKPQTEL